MAPRKDKRPKSKAPKYTKEVATAKRQPVTKTKGKKDSVVKEKSKRKKTSSSSTKNKRKSKELTSPSKERTKRTKDDNEDSSFKVTSSISATDTENREDDRKPAARETVEVVCVTPRPRQQGYSMASAAATTTMHTPGSESSLSGASNLNAEKQDDAASVELRQTLTVTTHRLKQAEKQMRAISKTRIADDYLCGQVRNWTKGTLWKLAKFITNDSLMAKVMEKASRHFQVSDDARDHWMATYAHVVRDGLNQKRNACAQDLRLTLESKYCSPSSNVIPEVHTKS
jgi:hypothetical protein